MNDSIISYKIPHRYLSYWCLEKNNIEFKIIEKLQIKEKSKSSSIVIALNCWSSYEIPTCYLIYLSLTFLFGDERLNPNAPLQCPIHLGKQHPTQAFDCRLPGVSTRLVRCVGWVDLPSSEHPTALTSTSFVPSSNRESLICWHAHFRKQINNAVLLDFLCCSLIQSLLLLKAPNKIREQHKHSNQSCLDWIPPHKG